jgi:ribonucleoside-diphosphate reductase alpha chain
LGVTGLAEYLFAKKMRYGSEESLQEVDRLIKFIRNSAYKSLIELAVEKGSFPQFDPYAYGSASFIRKLPASIRMDIKNHGVRCVTCLSVAPTGTISLLSEVSGGIEPLYAKAYVQKDNMGERNYVHSYYRQLLEKNEKSPDWYVDSFDISPENHFDMQVAVQKYVDGGVSKTINLSKQTKISELSKMLLEYMNDLKGVTVYRDGSRKNQPLTKLKEKEVREYLKKNSINDSIIEISCGSGSCEL